MNDTQKMRDSIGTQGIRDSMEFIKATMPDIPERKKILSKYEKILMLLWEIQKITLSL